MKRIRTKAELIESFSLTNVNCITADIYIKWFGKIDWYLILVLKTCLYDSQVKKKIIIKLLFQNAEKKSTFNRKDKTVKNEKWELRKGIRNLAISGHGLWS